MSSGLYNKDDVENEHSDMKIRGAPSTQSGFVLLTSSFLLLMHSLYILGVIDIGNVVMDLYALTGMRTNMDEDIETKEYNFDRHPSPLRVLIPLMSIPFLVWHIVKYVSLRLYLSN